MIVPDCVALDRTVECNSANTLKLDRNPSISTSNSNRNAIPLASSFDHLEYNQYLAASVSNSVKDPTQRNTYYTLDISLGVTQWTLYRRYSEFRSLKVSLEKLLGSRTNCKLCRWILEQIQSHQFPRRRFFSSSAELTTSTRQHSLDAFLKRLIHYVQLLTQQGYFMHGSQCDSLNVIHPIEEFIELDYIKFTQFLEDHGEL